MTLDLSVSVEGLQGLETPTPSVTPGCKPRRDWTLTYTVQRDDILFNIAQRYGTTVAELGEANCLSNINILSIGQVLKVPGSSQPSDVTYDCSWELLTPQNGTLAIPGGGTLTFNWRGPRAPRNLIRIHKPNGGTYERVIELRQNETINLSDIPDAGTYTWYVYPLDQNFVQISCLEGGPWTFRKEQTPTATPTVSVPGA
jgi:LysM repeat protein